MSKNAIKRAAVISCFPPAPGSFYYERVSVVTAALRGEADEVTVFASDFDHYTKKRANIDGFGGAEYAVVRVKAYRKNLSAARLSSHAGFSRGVSRALREYRPDFVYALVPPNSLVKACARYKKISSCKLVFDLLDMWPESLVAAGFKRALAAPLLAKWRALRNKHLKAADFLITECGLYREILAAQKVKPPPSETVFLSMPRPDGDNGAEFPDPGKAKPNGDNGAEFSDAAGTGAGSGGAIELCYLGSINNIIDIPLIAEFAGALSASVGARVHVIGDGERRAEFIAALERAGAEAVYHGRIYDAARKAEIFARCAFGLNIMKPRVAVGLTAKSIDYLRAGLPLINNIKGDTADMVERYGAGLNIGVAGSAGTTGEKRANTAGGKSAKKTGGSAAGSAGGGSAGTAGGKSENTAGGGSAGTTGGKSADKVGGGTVGISGAAACAARVAGLTRGEILSMRGGAARAFGENLCSDAAERKLAGILKSLRDV